MDDDSPTGPIAVLYTVNDVAVLLGLSNETVRRHIRKGRIKVTRIGDGGPYRIPATELARLTGEEAVA